jgi:predicted site-specific integrase-resolvase
MSKIYRPSEFAKKLGVTTRTLRRWDADRKLVAKRHPSGHRYYDESDVRSYLGAKEQDRRIVVYCRVSSQNQKDDLASQVTAMEQFCLARGIAVDTWVKEIGGGMNFKRKAFLSLMSQIQLGEIKSLIIAHKDRLVRFGFDYFQVMAQENGCEIIVANQEHLSPQHEMVEDLMAIVHTFSCRLYGLRKYKKVLKESLENQEELHESHSNSE